MKFTVEIEDFYMDEESNLEDTLKTFIIGGVAQQIQNSIKEKVDKEITLAVSSIVEKALIEKINFRIMELINSEKIMINKEEVLISDHIKSLFTSSTRWNNPNDQITALAKKYGDEMKQRYDFFYASKLVENMKTLGWIKEEVVNALIEHK